MALLARDADAEDLEALLEITRVVLARLTEKRAAGRRIAANARPRKRK